jgi:putative FmdB family regulatory protein
MPIYEYTCAKCKAHLELMQRISEAPLTVCPRCGGELHKQVSLSSFQFKGSGWYVTDYAKKNAAGANGNGNGHGANKDKGADGASAEKTAGDAAKDAAKPAAASEVKAKEPGPKPA